MTNLDELLELPWKKTFISIMRRHSMDKLVESGQYSFSQKHDAFLKSKWADVSPYTLLDPFRMGRLLDLTETIFNVPGDIVECGSFKGGTGLLLAFFLRENGIKKKLHLFDSFEGLPEPHAEHDKGYKQGEYKSNLDELQQVIAKHNLQEYITLHKGWFNTTVPPFTAYNPPIALLHIDCDLYESTCDSYAPLLPYVEAEGLVVFDDYNDGAGGEKRAVKEILKAEKLFYQGPAPQAYYYNSDSQKPAAAARNGLITYSFDHILANAPYLLWLEKIGRLDYASEIKNYLGQVA